MNKNERLPVCWQALLCFWFMAAYKPHGRTRYDISRNPGHCNVPLSYVQFWSYWWPPKTGGTRNLSVATGKRFPVNGTVFRGLNLSLRPSFASRPFFIGQDVTRKCDDLKWLRFDQWSGRIYPTILSSQREQPRQSDKKIFSAGIGQFFPVDQEFFLPTRRFSNNVHYVSLLFVTPKPNPIGKRRFFVKCWGKGYRAFAWWP